MFFGGSRGGGKTDGVLGKWLIKQDRYGPNFAALATRMEGVAFEDAIERSRALYEPIGAKLTVNRNIPRWVFPKGGRVYFRHLNDVSAADAVQGWNLTDAWVEEVGQHPTPDIILRLFGVLRSASGVPTQLVLTGNPGGAGQHWVADRYGLIPFNRGRRQRTISLDNGSQHTIDVIPSFVTDNPFLGQDYVDNLHLLGSPQLVKAWLDGDWSVVQGAFFTEWSAPKHIIEPFEIPDDWLRFRSMDWGYAKPFSVGWWAVASDDIPERKIQRGCMIRYREWYGCQEGKPNAGLRLDAELVAEGINERTFGEDIAYTVADPAMFSQDGGPSIAERMLMHSDLSLRPADNKRVSTRGAVGGWDMMRARLRGSELGPMVVCFSTCRDSIRTIPVLQHDMGRPEDLDTASEDHAADEWRYGCMSRPWVSDRPIKAKTEWEIEAAPDPGVIATVSMKDLMPKPAAKWDD